MERENLYYHMNKYLKTKSYQNWRLHY